MKDLLIKLDACDPAQKWATDKSWNEIYSTCHRGDWLLWLFQKTNPDDLQLLTLAKGHCANTVRHLMKDQRSIDAVDAAIQFGLGEITLWQLFKFRKTAAAVSAAISAASYAAVSAADTSSASYTAFSSSFASFSSVTFSSSAAYAAKTKNQQETADIARKYIPIEKFNIKIQ